MLIHGFNLSAADYRRSRRDSRIAAGAATVLALAVLLQAGYGIVVRRDVAAAGARLAAMETQVRQHEEQARAARAGVPPEIAKGYEAKVAALNQILDASAFSWTGLLLELERAVPPGVELRDISPDLATGKVMLTGTSRSSDELTAFLKGLAQRQPFRDVYLLREAEKQGEPGRNGRDELAFTVSLIYRGRP